MSPEHLDAQHLRAFQEALTPRAPRACSFASLRAGFAPAGGSVGGDFHDHLELDEHRQAVLIGDVTGHGLSSALVMAVASGAIREAFRWTQLPCAVMNDLHALLADLGERAGGPRLFSASLFVGVLESDGTLKYVNAGHPPGLVLRTDGSIERLDASVPPLGFVEPVHCRSVPQALAPGDRLLLYTDGVLRPGESVGDWLDRARSLSEREDHEIVESLLAEGAEDDRTALILGRRPEDQDR